MARGVVEWGRRGAKWCSYRRITITVCSVNLFVALFVLRSLYSSLYVGDPFPENKHSDDPIKRIEESIRIRKAAEPVELVKVVRKLRKEAYREEKRKGKLLPLPVKQKLTNEILQRLRSLKDRDNATEQREAVELWRAEKLRDIKMASRKRSSNSSIPAQEAKMLKRALGSNWLMFMEDIGLWMPAGVTNTEHDDKPANEPDEEEIIPGRPLPPECHAELHTDYDGAAVRWGLTHHKESAADCCQACLDHAKQAKPGEMKCNIWVYCPSEFGCYSPDIYEHKHQECWLKQAEKPRLNFKDKYSERYRSSHPTAPVVVPWISGVVS
ncbi:hypothetical protein ACMD2_18470 [Ananas comosus]|uniref:Apple domain-containing protein n=2 Tax=Ananas comosus TaxID=4615 RepID=A0A199VPE3_ANACO|nr:hypothetical protein ACMD2_18475 [Ananas comosus]OAY78578.1 hypothetical protein ACMD2_18470 [Ananas comosus]CAD1826996.1 unnamed protein product [Ananas comosus var. bracteatus]